MPIKLVYPSVASALVALLRLTAGTVHAAEPRIVGGNGRTCNDDPQCIERLHPSIPMAAVAHPGQSIVLHTRNVLIAMIDHLLKKYAYMPDQAYVICSVALDLRIGQLLDAPNVRVTAILPLDIFVDD